MIRAFFLYISNFTLACKAGHWFNIFYENVTHNTEKEPLRRKSLSPLNVAYGARTYQIA